MSSFRKSLVVFLSFLFASSFYFAANSVCRASVEPFPLYPSLKNNVEFWKKVYTEFPTTKGFVHDSYELSVIYAVVDLIDSEEPGAPEKNRKRIKKAKEKYSNILLKLSRGEKPETKEEERVLSLWGKGVTTKKLREAAESIRFQHCIRERFLEGLERSGRHMDAMRKIFLDKGLPVELTLLPHVESSFDYNAYSKFGAAGIWQFIRPTGRRFLTIDYTVDERRDPIIATHAAALYLKENYEKLGSWPLALTAYNHGANGMMRAQKECGDFEKILRDYKSRSFGFASRNFYAQFLAAREIAENYQKYFKSVRIEPPLQANTVKLPGYFALDDLVNHFGLAVNDIRSLNPALREPVFTGQKYIPKGYAMRLPPASAFAERVASIPAEFIRKEQIRSRFYRVSRGDTAGKIANMHKVKLRDLIDSNNLSASARIFVGQNLVIPVPGENKSKTTKNLYANLAPQAAKLRPSGYTRGPEKVGDSIEVKTISQIAKKNSKQKSSEEPAVLSLKEEEREKIRTGSEEAKAIRELVQEQETQPELLAEEGEKAVDLASDTLRENPAVILGDFQVEQVKVEGAGKVGVIRVEAWETLGHYADWLEVETSRIRRLNKLAFGLPIKTSQKIKIPLTAVNQDLFEERRYEFHKGIEEDFFTAFRVVETETYTVKKGDTLWNLCHEELELPFWLIKKYNSLIAFDKLKANQVLVIPIVEKMG